jgi:hypothetical protein
MRYSRSVLKERYIIRFAVVCAEMIKTVISVVSIEYRQTALFFF